MYAHLNNRNKKEVNLPCQESIRTQFRNLGSLRVDKTQTKQNKIFHKLNIYFILCILNLIYSHESKIRLTFDIHVAFNTQKILSSLSHYSYFILM